MSARIGMEKWHRALGDGSTTEALAAIIRADAVFHSPVVYTPQEGRDIVVSYLAAAGKVLNTEAFRYVREFSEGNQALLEFVTELDGIRINGIDLITFDDDGMIADFKVMVRPLKAINKVWELMGAQLARQG
ncbi:nuclear transport factor 2 family protein [Altererythrobacter aerius]|uniref:Nuclear transport factor 2 family protein n=1 Tax=Tsuneonella aeria TaxID=1837929 RepID=A0A6I4TDQ5_9SPHN|nr:nuclear transport factor 2 family protein [Tsuneonella aeria]MXO75431.1 nuclear transport factor 2 family protein [Tsuneonella aeria]